jgi:hypothetical protein
MKNLKILQTMFIVMLLVGALLAWAGPAAASSGASSPASQADGLFALQAGPGTKLVLGGSYTLAEDERLDGSLFILGGAADLAPGSLVDGDIVLLGGSLAANGRVAGSISALGGMLRLSETSVIEGDLNILGSSVTGEAQAAIQGDINSEQTSMLPLIIPGDLRLPIPNIQVRFNPFWDLLWILFQSMLWAAAATLVALVAPQAVQRVGRAFVAQPIVAGGLGLLTAVVAPLVMLVMAITIIGIPLAVLLALALAVVWAYGLIAIGTELGKRLAQMGKADWALALSAALGTFLLTLVVNSVGEIIPCVGWIVPLLAGLLGVGAVLLTRFGTRSFPDIVAVQPSDQGVPGA